GDWHLRLSVSDAPAGAQEGETAGAWVPIWPPPVGRDSKTKPKRKASPSDPVVTALHGIGVAPHRHYRNGLYDALPCQDADPATLEDQILQRLPGTEVICLGRSLDLFKQVGSPDQLEASYGISQWQGTHGIGHTRLSTESRVDLSHSQPFW